MVCLSESFCTRTSRRPIKGQNPKTQNLNTKILAYTAENLDSLVR
jgi:hypothetical protein